MKIFDFITRLLPETKKSSIEDDIAYTKKVFDEITLPAAQAAIEIFKVTPPKSKGYQLAEEAFYDITKMHKKNFSEDFAFLLRNGRANIDILERKVKAIVEESTFSEAVSLQKAQIIRATSSLSFVADSAIELLNYLMMCETTYNEAGQKFDTISEREIEKYRKHLFSVMSQFCQEPKTLENLLKNIPDVIVTPKNLDQIQAMFAKDGEPFNEPIDGFVHLPILFVREQIASYQINRYNHDKNLKKQFELRVLALKSQQAGQPNAALEKQLQYYENEAAKLGDKIASFEAKYKG